MLEYSPKTHDAEEVLSGIIRSVKEAKEGETAPLDSLWSQL